MTVIAKVESRGRRCGRGWDARNFNVRRTAALRPPALDKARHFEQNKAWTQAAWLGGREAAGPESPGTPGCGPRVAGRAAGRELQARLRLTPDPSGAGPSRIRPPIPPSPAQTAPAALACCPRGRRRLATPGRRGPPVPAESHPAGAPKSWWKWLTERFYWIKLKNCEIKTSSAEEGFSHIPGATRPKGRPQGWDRHFDPHP